MALETGTYISDLVVTNPTGSDPLAFADDHLRLVKSTIKNTFPNITGPVTKTNAQINAMGTVAEVLAAVYPVGSIYTNATNATNPGTLLGFGTWVSFGAGRVPVGFDAGNSLFNAAEKTGGSYDATLVGHTHTWSGSAITSDAGTHAHSINDPGHAHSYVMPNTGYGAIPAAESNTAWYQGGTTGASATGISMNAAGNHNHSVSMSGTTSSSGSSATNANVQPFITVYMWKRTA